MAIDQNPEWTDKDFADARPFSEVHPEFFSTWQEEKKGGRPKTERLKRHIGFRLAADVVEGVKATGRGYNARVEKILREALAKGLL